MRTKIERVAAQWPQLTHHMAAGELVIVASIAVALLAVALARVLFLAARKQNTKPWLLAIRVACERTDSLFSRELPVEIMPHLLLGDKRCANELALLEAFGITHILNVAGRCGATDHTATRKGYLELSAQDEEGYDIMQHLHTAIAFINKARSEGGRTLIHCQAGINRSGALACAALMLHERLPLMEAVVRCKKARGIILTNHSFQAQLIELAVKERLLGEKPTLDPAVARASSTKQPRKSAALALSGLT